MRFGAATWLGQEVQNLTFVIDRPPQPVFSATYPDDHLIEMPTSTDARTAAPQVSRNQPPELQKSASNFLVRHLDAAFGHQILDIAE